MRVNDLRLSLANINPKQVPAGCSDCVSVTFNTERGTNKVIGYNLVCCGVKGSTYSLKLDNSAENKAIYEEVQARLRKEEIVRLVPNNVRITAYAFLSDTGSLLSGVSVKADSVVIADDDDDN
jgi:hypothetical protein